MSHLQPNSIKNNRQFSFKFLKNFWQRNAKSMFVFSISMKNTYKNTNRTNNILAHSFTQQFFFGEKSLKFFFVQPRFLYSMTTVSIPTWKQPVVGCTTPTWRTGRCRWHIILLIWTMQRRCTPGTMPTTSGQPLGTMLWAPPFPMYTKGIKMPYTGKTFIFRFPFSNSSDSVLLRVKESIWKVTRFLTYCNLMRSKLCLARL